MSQSHFCTPVHNLHRPLTLTAKRLGDILCWRDQRYVGQQLAFSYDRKRIMLEQNEISAGLVGKYVDSYAYADGRFEVRWRGHALPYTVFDKDQRVTHAAIIENKRLSAVLAYVKELQDQKPPNIKLVGKQRSRFTPTGRKSGRRSFLDQAAQNATRMAGQGSDM